MTVNKISIKKVEDLAILSNAWKILENGRDMTVFQSYDWNILLMEEYFSITYNNIFSNLFVYYICDNDNPILLLPIIIQKKTIKAAWYGREKGCYILGVNSYSDYINLIYDKFNEYAFEKLIEAIKEDYQGLPIYINFLRYGCETQKYCEKNGIEPIRITKSAYIDIPPDQETYNQILSKNTKQNLRTALNRLNKDEMNYELQCCSHIDDESDIKKMISIHRERLESKVKKHDGGYIHVLSRVLRNRNKRRIEDKYDIVDNSMKRSKNSCFVIVRLNGVIVSYLYGLVDNKAFRVMHNCFNEEYKFYSPMFRGAYDFILSQCETRSLNVNQIDFTRGDEEYKFKLGAKELLLYHYML